MTTQENRPFFTPMLESDWAAMVLTPDDWQRMVLTESDWERMAGRSPSDTTRSETGATMGAAVDRRSQPR